MNASKLHCAAGKIGCYGPRRKEVSREFRQFNP
jgi:hypothetical protein